MHHSDLEDILKKASVVVAQACKINHHEGKQGGYLCIATSSGVIETVTLIGTVPEPAKAKKYFDYCQEKAIRLAHHRDHKSSWESKDAARECRGGAIRCKENILSFAGLPEHWDEAVVLTIGYLGPHRIISHADLENICRISSVNNHVHKLISACADETLRLRRTH
ncbi:MAG: hypothetical protein RLY66_190 [Candidatus Parcubacteria bacterium]|jgi:hypothetical protein